MRSLQLIFWGVICGLGVVPHFAEACNIPVFRYALERWEPDNVQVIVFHDGLSDDEVALIQAVKKESRSLLANVIVVSQPIDVEMGPELAPLWEQLKTEQHPDPPVVVVRTRVGRGNYVNIWTGRLADLNDIGLLDSPARKDVASRLLSGDAGVWLVLKSADQEKSAEVVELLQTSLPKIAEQIPIPEGIGLPGSELYSAIPLDMRFSVLEIAADDPQETFLINWLKTLRPEEYAAGDPLVVPVFGRGRALEVIPGSLISEGLLKDLSAFLCGACSCQVKEMNPGFDLLLSADWMNELFGEEPPDIPDTEPGQLVGGEKPQMVVIPSGGVRAEKVEDVDDGIETVIPETAEEPTTEHDPQLSDSGSAGWWLVCFVGLVVIVTGLAGIRLQEASA